MRPLQLTGAFIWSTGPHEYSLLLLLLLLSLLSLSAHWHPALQKSRFLEPCDLFLSHRQIDSDPSRRPAGPTHARKIINSSSPTTRKNYQLLRTGRPEPIGPIDPLVKHVWFSTLAREY